MFDFDDFEQVSAGATERQASTAKIMVVYRTEQCLHTVQEAVCFEGLELSGAIGYDADKLPDLLIGCSAQLLLIETGNDFGTGVEQQLFDLRHLLPRECQVVLLGPDGSMSLVRRLRQQGFLYLLWPASRQDIVDQLKLCLHQRQMTNAHNTMRVAVMGCKGGCGTTLVAASLARSLADETGQSGMLVDHGYRGGNMHVMLGLSDLADKASAKRESVVFDQALDFIQASSLEIKVSEKLNYLTGPDRERIHEAVDLLSWDNNFLVEDCANESPFSNREPDEDWLSSLNALVITVHPSLSGLYLCKCLLERLEQRRSSVRCFLVLNYCQPNKQIDRTMVEQYLNRSIACELPWYPHCEDYLITGKSFVSGTGALGLPLQNLARQLLGKPVCSKTFLSWLLRRIS